MTDLSISHVVYGSGDVEATLERLQVGSGLQAIRGSTFPHLGLADWFIPFEDQYIELLTVADPDLAARTPFGRWVTEQTASHDRLLAWALDVDDAGLEAAAQRLDLEPDPLEFLDNTGVQRTSRLVGAARAFAEPCFPYYIAWDDPAGLRRGLREASASVNHESRARGVAWVEVAGQEAALHEWMDDTDAPVRITSGDPGLRAIGISTEEGEIVLRSSA